MSSSRALPLLDAHHWLLTGPRINLKSWPQPAGAFPVWPAAAILSPRSPSLPSVCTLPAFPPQSFQNCSSLPRTNWTQLLGVPHSCQPGVRSNFTSKCWDWFLWQPNPSTPTLRSLKSPRVFCIFFLFRALITTVRKLTMEPDSCSVSLGDEWS